MIAPDRDQKGLEYARQVAAAFNGNVKGWVYAGDKAHWQDPSDGYDLADWIAELRQQGLDDTAIRQFILGAIGQKREIAVPVSSRGDGETEVTHELVGQLLAQTQARFDIHKLVHPTLAKAISSKAQSFNLPPEILLSVFLVVASSLVPHKLQLGEDYLIPGLLWLGLVGDSGTGKSPVLDLFTSPLQNLQLEAFESYKQELKEWENTEDRDEDLKPKRRFYYISDLTWEAIKKAMEARSHCLVYSDELAGFVNGLGQYKPRAGNDRQRWLTAYNGGSIDILRVDESHHIPSVHLSILGGIQPSVLHKLIKSDGEVVDGFWARFMWVEMPHRKVPCPLDMPKSNLLSVLESVYQVLDRRASVSTTFELDAKGKQVWRQWWDEIETLKDDELNPFIRALYPKLLERAGRIALVAHCVNCAVANTPPGETIPVETLKWAIAFTRWTLQQARAVYGDCGYAESPEAQRVARFVQRFQGKQVNGRRVVTWWTGGKKPSAKDARNWLANLVNLGYAQPVKGTPDQPDYTVLVLGTSGTSQVQNRPNADYDDVPAGTSSGTSPGTSQVHPVHAPWEILDDVPGNVPDVPGNVPDAGTPESLYLSGFPEIVPDVPDVPDDVPEEQPPTLTKEEILERFPLGSLVLAPRQSRPLPVVGVVSTFNLLKLQQPNGEPWYVHWVDAKLVKE
ncbi:MAG: DUF3987 domain-containing protein [Gloeomargarita sp. SKYBB_i_bin120]|nr:DUF3987 domain-containing protein [Gloeomargarita sp. SKYB120]MDW8177624.1 DUF3987 domain-containing protein [Gloeomargarita sp. SKYBB_i_bin120]